MDPFIFLIILAGLYGILLFFDLFFKSCAHYPYIQLLDSLGLEIKYFSIQWKTKKLNRLFLKWGNFRPQFWKLWFSLGVYVSLVFLPVTICFLMYNVFNLVFRNDHYSKEPAITLVIPGVNLPISEVGYYIITLAICSLIHEIGHALAAVVEDLGILEFGCNVYFILPITYVRLATDKLTSLKLKNKLTIFCAGVWHNLFFSLITYLIYCSLPTVFSPFFYSEQGISVTHVRKNSPLSGSPKGIFVNDIILGINDCKIKNEDDWYNCLNQRELLLPAVCVDSELVNLLDESVPLKHLGNGVVDCCDPTNAKNLCFEYIDIDNKELELPGHVCLPGRTVIEKSTAFCTLKPHVCPNNLYCLKPVLSNNTFLLKIVSKGKNIIYIGHPNDLYRTLEVSSYIEKSFLPVKFPDVSTKLVKYIIVISLGLAFVNVFPVMYMDGEYIFKTLALIMFKDMIGKKKTILAVTVATWFFTIFLIVTIVYTGFQI